MAHIQQGNRLMAGGASMLATIGGTLLYSADFETGSLPSGWSLETNGSGTSDYPSSGAHGGTYAYRASMIAASGVQQSLKRNVSSHNLRQVYIDFWAKMPTAQKQGCKFLKIFGQQSGGYANCTFGMVYAGNTEDGTLKEVAFGDGTATSNDTQNTIRYSSGGVIGRAPSPTILRPMGVVFSPSDWGTDWHHFRIMAKFNSGNTAETEVADGEFYVEIDGNVYLNATGIFNRHYSNGPIDNIAFIDYTTNTDAPFEVWLDDIKISTGGFT